MIQHLASTTKSRSPARADPFQPARYRGAGRDCEHQGPGPSARDFGRANLPEAVTDVIVDRGEGKVIRRLANDASARFSDAGFSSLVAHASGDDELVEILGLRADFPAKFLADLLRRAKPSAASLLAVAPPAVQEEIRQVLNEIAREAQPQGRNFGVAEELVKLMKGLQRARRRRRRTISPSPKKFDEVTVALAVLNDMPIEMVARLMEGPRADLILIPCRSARLNWPTVRVDPAQPAGQAFGQRADHGGRGTRFPQAVDGDGAAHRALLAIAQQDREVGSRSALPLTGSLSIQNMRCSEAWKAAACHCSAYDWPAANRKCR